MLKKLFFLLSLFHLFFSQNEFIRFTTISVSSGLSSPYVRDILQDSIGFIWVGTSEGLNKYDGNQFKVFQNQGLGTNEISSNDIKVLASDGEGNIWIGTNRGVDIFDPDKEVFKNLSSQSKDTVSLSNNYVTSIVQGENGAMWVGTASGLNLFNKKTKKFKTYTKEELANDSIQTIFFDKKEHRLWIGTKDGLYFYDNKKEQFTPIKDETFKLFPIVNTITKFDNFLLLGLFNPKKKIGRVVLFDTKKNVLKELKTEPVFKNFPQVGLKTIQKDQNNNLWFGTVNDYGLFQFDTKSKRLKRHSQSDFDLTVLTNDDVRKITIDKSGLIWVGTNGGGLSKIRYAKNKHFLSVRRNPNNKNGLSTNQVLSIFEDSSDEVWYGTVNGLTRYTPKKGTFKTYYNNPNRNSISNSVVTALLESNSGSFWIGTQNGLNKMDRLRGRFTIFKARSNRKNSLAGNDITTIIQGKSNNIIWIGTTTGFSKYDERSSSFTSYKINSNKLKSLENNIQAIAIEASGKIWLGTQKGLFLFNPVNQRFTPYFYNRELTNTVSSDHILSLYIDINNTLWIGTDNGLSQYNRKQNNFTRITTLDGLSNMRINSIIGDKSDVLWLGTSKGLDLFKFEERSFRNFTVDNGLVSNEFNRGAAHFGFSGKVYFGTPNGSVEFFKNRLLLKRNAPKIAFSSIQVNYQKFIPPDGYNHSKRVTLSYDQNSIAFEIAVLDFTVPSKNSFQYKMEGIDNTWINAGSRKFVTYQLQPNQYTFRVRPVSYTSKYNNLYEKHLTIILKPPFWKAWWFQVSLIFIIVALIFTLIALRTRTQRLREDELAKEVFRRTKELRNKTEELNKTNMSLEKEINVRTETEHELINARKETDTIFQNVNEGLFLLNKKFEISNQYSAELENIFNKSDLAKLSFIKLMKSLATEKILDNLKDYLELSFNQDIDDESLSELNPLSKIELHFHEKDGTYKTKHLEFIFRRVSSKTEITSLLVTTRDITEIVELQKKLNTTINKNKVEMEQLLSILRVPPNDLREYLDIVKKELKLISRLFQEEKGDYRSILEKAFRMIHNLKGNAIMLELEFFVTKFHTMEEFMTQILDKKKIVGNDFLSIIFEVNEIDMYIKDMETLINRVVDMSDKLKSDNSSINQADNIKKNLESIVHNLAKSLNKKAELKFSCSKYSSEHMTDTQRKIITDISIQLIRNSLFHGIESSNVRKKEKKAPKASIEIDIRNKNNYISLNYKDDGSGLLIDKIRARAIESNIFDQKTVENMSNIELAKLIFKDGFTTQNVASKDAGRGKGMSFIKEVIKENDGKMKFSFLEGQYFKISIDIPINLPQNT